tara:strand:+ start:354 stop:509 length:156 start_codon:yes stop_codon:yes gene_type:complete
MEAQDEMDYEEDRRQPIDEERIPKEHQHKAGELILATRKFDNKEEDQIDLA